MATVGDVGSSSWASSQRRSAPAQTATTTSLNVTSAACFTARTSSIGSRAMANRRDDVTGALNDNRGARPVGCSSISSPASLVGSSRARPSSPGVRRITSTAVSRTPGHCSPADRRARSARRPGNPAAHRSWSGSGPARRASPSNGPEPCAGHLDRRGRHDGGRAAGSVSSSAVISSAPVLSSIAATWTLAYRATRSSGRPSMTHSSHSGRDRSSGVAWARPTRRASAASSPPGGSAVWRTWYSMSKLRSVVHDGRPRPNGTSATLRRADGSRASRSATSSVTAS